MLYDRVMRNIQKYMNTKHTKLKHMNSFINAGSQGKLRNFLENSLSGSRVSGPT